MIGLDHKIVLIRAAALKQRATIILSKASIEQDVLQMLENSLPNNEVPPDIPVILCWIGNELFSNDNIVVEKVTREEYTLAMEVLITKHDEAIHANVVTVPVVQVLLGQLISGSYQVVVTEKTMNNKEHINDLPASGTAYRFSFLVK